MMINTNTQHFEATGSCGMIECALDMPTSAPIGLALIAHPHPLFGGTMDNKVVTTITRALMQLGFACLRSNFRGVGKTSGEHDKGIGETQDLVAVIEHTKTQHPEWQNLPITLAGFSFGAYVQTHVAQALTQQGTNVRQLILVGTATSRWHVLPVPENTLVIHGEQDDTVELTSVLDWARPQALPVVVVPGADHFFHKKLPVLKRLLLNGVEHDHIT